jgi:hypothetical protein
MPTNVPRVNLRTSILLALVFGAIAAGGACGEAPCPTDAASCPGNCREVTAIFFDPAVGCVEPGDLAGVTVACRDDDLVEAIMPCYVRIRDDAHFFIHGLLPGSSGWAPCADEIAREGIRICE